MAKKGTSHSQKVQHYSSLTISLLSIISRKLVGGIYWDRVGVFYSPSRLGHRTLVGEVWPLYWDTVGVSHSPSRLGHRTLFGEVLPLYWDTVGVSHSPSHRTLFGGSLTSLLRYSRCIPQPQPTWPQDTFWGKSYPSTEIQSVYPTVPADLATGHFLGEVWPLYWDTVGVFDSPADLATGHFLGDVLPLYWDSVGVSHTPSRLGHRTLFGGSLTPLLRYSRCIPQPQPTWPQDTFWGKSYPSTDIQSVYPTPPADFVTGHFLGEVLPLYWDTVGVFNSPTDGATLPRRDPLWMKKMGNLRHAA